MLKGLKGVLFEEEPEKPAEKSVMIQPPEPWPTPPPGAPNVLDQFNTMMTALEAKLPDRALRISVALTTLNTQGITKESLISAIESKKVDIDNAKITVQNGFDARSKDIQEMTKQYKELSEKAEAIRKESFSLSEKLSEEIKQSNAIFDSEFTKLHDLVTELKGV